MAAVAYPHIELREDGVPILSGTRMKVAHIAVDRTFHKFEPEEIQRQYPQWNLSLAQIYAALAYYYDHKEELDRYLEETERFADEMRAKQGETPIRAKLKSRVPTP